MRRIYSSDAIEATNTGFRRSRLRRRGQSGSFLFGVVDRTKSEFGFYSLIPFCRHPTHLEEVATSVAAVNCNKSRQSRRQRSILWVSHFTQGIRTPSFFIFTGRDVT